MAGVEPPPAPLAGDEKATYVPNAEFAPPTPTGAGIGDVGEADDRFWLLLVKLLLPLVRLVRRAPVEAAL